MSNIIPTPTHNPYQQLSPPPALALPPQTSIFCYNMDRIITILRFVILCSVLSIYILYYFLVSSLFFYISDCVREPPLSARDFKPCMKQLFKEDPIYRVKVGGLRSGIVLINFLRSVEKTNQPYLVTLSLTIRQISSSSAASNSERRLKKTMQTRQARRTCQWGIYEPVTTYYHQ